jgi:hypothetical protein
MQGTLENRMECHRIAHARQVACKPIWDRKIDIKGILREDQKNKTDAHASSVAKQIAALLRTKLPKDMLDVTKTDGDWELSEIVEYLETLEPEDGIDGCSVLDCLNDQLAQLYDWADVNRVWLG